MARKAIKPIICVEHSFDGQRSIEDAFAEAYALFFLEKDRKSKSSADTFGSSKLSDYNGVNPYQEVRKNGKPSTAA